MNSFYNKICDELKTVVKLNDNNIKNSCIIYAKNYDKVKRTLEKSNIDFFEYPFISAIGANLSYKEIVKFAKISIVNFISKQTKVSTQIDLSKEILHTSNFYLNNIYGEGLSLAVIDTGINPHIDFCLGQNRIIKFVDLINGNAIPYDDNGHGTFVTSIACGSGFASGGKFSGIAPKTNIVSIKALEGNGETGAYKILEAMQWIYDNYKKYNIKVVCMSFGSTPLGKNDPLIVGAEVLWNLGIVVVAAAGNSGPDGYSIKSPGFSSKIITVGGIDDNREAKIQLDKKSFHIADFSSRGPAGAFYKPDLVAPAVNITGAGFNKDKVTFYLKMSGTSVATPMIAGVCCLIFSKYPHISPDQMKIRLLHSCDRLSFKPNDEGYGLLNLTRFFS